MNDDSLKEVLAENEDVLARLAQQLASPYRVIPFVGAGVSMAFGCPGWAGFLREVADRIGARAEVDALLARSEFEEAADLLIQKYQPTGFYGEVARRFGREVARDRKLDGVIALLPELTAGPLATTNFDQLIERVFDERSLALSVVRGTDVDNGTAALMLNRRCLLKLHGDAEERNGRIFTREEYNRHYGPKGSRDPSIARLPLPGLLARLMGGQAPLLFLGCSLVKDRVLDILHEVHLAAGSAGGHFAFVQVPADPEQLAERRTFCSKHGIHPIWYPAGEHQLIARLIEHALRPRHGEVRSPQSSEPKTEVEARVEARMNTLAEVFQGRRVELEQLEKEASHADVPLVVTSEAGYGKSALLAALAKRLRDRGCAVAVHCFSRLDGLSSPTEAYASLTAQIRRLLGLPREDGKQGREALWTALSLWSKHGKDQLYVVVDALDEVEGVWRRPGPNRLLPNCAMIVSARAGDDEVPPDLGEWLAGAKRYPLGTLLRADVSHWLEFHPEVLLRKLHSAEMVDALMESTGGIALHVRLLMDDLAEAVARGDRVDAARVRNTPRGLEAYVRRHLHDLLREGGLADSDAKRFFSVLCCARAPLSERELSDITRGSVLALPWTVTRWFTSRREPNGATTYRFAHEFLAIRFADPLRGSVVQAEEDLLVYCRNWKGHRSEYALRYLAEHLSARGARSELEALSRNDEYGIALLKAFPNEPELRLGVFQKAFSSALDAGDIPGATRLLLDSARISERLKGAETPLSALRAGSLARSKAIANLDEPSYRVLWELLLAWELSETNRTAAAIDILEGLSRKRTLEMRGWAGHVATLLLSRLTFAGDVWSRLVGQLLDYAARTLDDPRSTNVSELLLARGELDAARMLPGAETLNALALAYVARRRYDDATATVRALAPKEREYRYQVLARTALEAGDPGQARRWLEASRTVSTGDRHPAYAEGLLAGATAIGAALGVPGCLERLLEPHDRSPWISATADAACLTTLAGGQAGALWENFEKSVGGMQRGSPKIEVLISAARGAIAADRARAERLLHDAERLATSLEHDLAKNLAEASDVWGNLSRLRGEFGDLEGGIALLAKISTPYLRQVRSAFGQLIAREAATDVDAALERSLHFLAEDRRDRGLPAAEIEARADVVLAVLKGANASDQSSKIRDRVGELLRSAQQQPRVSSGWVLGKIASSLLTARRLKEALEVVELIDDDFSSRSWRSKLAAAWAELGELARARELLAAVGDSRTLRDPVCEKIVERLAAEGDIAGAEASLREISWGGYEFTRAKMTVLAAQLRAGNLESVKKQLATIENSNEAMRAIETLGRALPAGVPAEVLEASIFLQQDPLERLVGFASFGAGLAMAGRAAESERGLALAAEEAPLAADLARTRHQHIARSESWPWLELAIFCRRARRKDLGDAAFEEALRHSRHAYDRDENRGEMVNALAAMGETEDAFALVHAMHVEQASIRGALTAIAEAGPTPPDGFAEYVEELREGNTHVSWATAIWAAIRDEARLRADIAARPLDRPLAHSYAAALARMWPDSAVAIAKILASAEA